MDKRLRLVWIISIVVSLVALVAFFLPISDVKGDYDEYIDLFGDLKVSEELDLTVKEMKSPSLYTITRVYYNETEGEDRILVLIFFGGIGGLALISCLWSLAKRPILLFLNSVLLGLLYRPFLLRYDSLYGERVWGIAYYLIIACVVILAICSIWMFIVKRKIKKERLKMNAGGTL